MARFATWNNFRGKKIYIKKEKAKHTTGSMPQCNGRVGSFCDEQPRNGSSREMRLEELTSLLPPLWRFPHSGERIMKNILPPLLRRCRWTKKIRGKKAPKQKKNPQGCSVMQLPGRGWREGRAAPSDSSGEEEAQRERLNYSQGIKGTGILSLQPSESVLGLPSPVCLVPPSPKNHRDEFFHGPSISKPAAEARLTFLPLLLHAALWTLSQTAHSALVADSVMDEGPEQGTCPGGSLCPLAGEQPGRGAWEWGIRAWIAAAAEEGWHPCGSLQPRPPGQNWPWQQQQQQVLGDSHIVTPGASKHQGGSVVAPSQQPQPKAKAATAVTGGTSDCTQGCLVFLHLFSCFQLLLLLNN